MEKPELSAEEFLRALGISESPSKRLLEYAEEGKLYYNVDELLEVWLDAYEGAKGNLHIDSPKEHADEVLSQDIHYKIRARNNRRSLAISLSTLYFGMVGLLALASLIQKALGG